MSLEASPWLRETYSELDLLAETSAANAMRHREQSFASHMEGQRQQRFANNLGRLSQFDDLSELDRFNTIWTLNYDLTKLPPQDIAVKVPGRPSYPNQLKIYYNFPSSLLDRDEDPQDYTKAYDLPHYHYLGLLFGKVVEFGQGYDGSVLASLTMPQSEDVMRYYVNSWALKANPDVWVKLNGTEILTNPTPESFDEFVKLPPVQSLRRTYGEAGDPRYEEMRVPIESI